MLGTEESSNLPAISARRNGVTLTVGLLRQCRRDCVSGPSCVYHNSYHEFLSLCNFGVVLAVRPL